MPSKKLETLLRRLANCTFLWLLLVARRGPTFSQKASSHLPHASHLLANGRPRPPPFALRGVHPSLSRDGSRRKWYILRTRLAKQFLKPGTERRDTIPEESSLSCNDIGLGIGWLTTDKWSVTALIEPFGQATRTFIAERRGVEEARVFAKWSPRGCRRVIFAPKSPCARWWRSVGGASGKYLEYPQHLSNRPKEGKKRDAFPTSR